MAAPLVDIVGATPISFTDTSGSQRVVPLSALQLSGSTVQVKSAWSTWLDANETITVLRPDR